MKLNNLKQIKESTAPIWKLCLFIAVQIAVIYALWQILMYLINSFIHWSADTIDTADMLMRIILILVGCYLAVLVKNKAAEKLL
jgi:membrane protein insertase Oxa1/YidC/SpoIIIJ